MFGWFLTVLGVLYFGYGLAVAFSGDGGTDALDGILFGGLLLVVGCVILQQRRRDTQRRNVSNEPENPSQK